MLRLVEFLLVEFLLVEFLLVEFLLVVIPRVRCLSNYRKCSSRF
jgi:hypothetical protein